MNRLIVVSNRLPVRIDADGTAHRTEGGLASALEGAEMNVPQLWVGWPGGAVEDFASPDFVAEELRKSDLVPVFLSQQEIDGFYEGYSNATLWPLLHYMVERARFSRDWWDAYRRVNQRYADAILEISEAGDQVWIHDYHLFLLPSMLRRGRRRLKIGFFLHTPFCSSEIFRVLPERGDLLRGLLGADVIGFHTYNYLRHFRSALLHVLGWESEMEGIWHEGREVRMGVYPIGHNHRAFARVMAGGEFAGIVAGHLQDLAGKRMILSVERLDYTKGLPEKLRAMRMFLETVPEMRDEVLFVLIAVPSRQGVPEYDQLTEVVQREVGAINGEFGKVGHMPVQFLHRGFPLEDLTALYALAEVCLVTPLRDGMNLVAKEFLDCQDPSFSERPGVLILSEFAGAANELSHALMVNPHDVDQVAGALKRALEMPDEERRERIEIMQTRLRKQDSGNWARRFVGDLDKVSEEGGGTEITDLTPLVGQLADLWRMHGKLGLFLDYDGTLRDFVDVPDHALPDAALGVLLGDLASCDGVEVVLVSGRTPGFMERHLGGLGVTLVAEHGYRWLNRGAGEWELFNPHVNIEWKPVIREHLEQASILTPGSHVEEKQSALVWHYRAADPEFGLWRARGLLAELTSMAANLPVTVHHGKKIVEVSSLQVSKGAAVDYLMHLWECGVALVAGDDQTDETMITLTPQNVEFFTVKIGEGSSRATFRTDINGFRTFLGSLRDRLCGI